MKLFLIVLTFLTVFMLAFSAAQPVQATPLQTYDPQVQAAELFYNEARIVYLGNLERRKAGQPPLRWNRELTLAARWFAWDSVENRTYGWIGHQDLQGGMPGDRARANGYLGSAGAENAYWASWLMTPEDAINGWMNSPGHRANLLAAGPRETGVGLYSLAGGDPTFAVQDFGYDDAYYPLVINDEAPDTSSPNVQLYQYNPSGLGGLERMDAATEMMISNDANFSGASWQPYQAESNWTLSAGEGWKTVYSRIRDGLGRVYTASDSIYLGAALPTTVLNLSQLSQTRPTAALGCLNGGALTYAQFSLDWMLDDTHFTLLWGNGGSVRDDSASGRSTFQLNSKESSAWAYTTSFFPDAPLIAYFRIKTSSNSSPNEVARFQVEANGVAKVIQLKGTDFSAANQYQEFAVPFTFHNNPQQPFLIFQFWRSADALIALDGVTVFTAPQKLNGSSYAWAVPGGNYRGQDVWVRYSDASGSTFSAYRDSGSMSGLSAAPTRVYLLAEVGKYSGQNSLRLSSCGVWQVKDSPGWLDYSVSGNLITLSGKASQTGILQGDLTLIDSQANTLAVPVTLQVVDKILYAFLPAVLR